MNWWGRGLSILIVVLVSMGVFAVIKVPSSDAAAGLVVRAPILISSNSDFTSWNGVVSGHGLPGDPYIIDGWEINASAACGIRILDTTSSFVVRDVHVFHGDISTSAYGTYDGISLENVSNARIDNVTVEGCRSGISALYSTHVFVTGTRTSHNNFSGIEFHQSENVSAIGNLAYDNSASELYMGFCKNSIMEDNTANDSGFGEQQKEGIDIWQSENVSIVGNNLDRNGNSILIETSHHCTISSNTITNDTGHAIYLYYSDNCTVFLNNILSADNSLAIQASANNKLFHNNFHSNTWASDPGPNELDDGYQSGGNYWFPYHGTDLYSGAGQDVQGPDGIGDDPYEIGGGLVDNYPLMLPYHTVINIDGNDDFTAENGVTRGNGTKGNPYTIDIWLINANLADGGAAGITIKHTDAFFVISDVIVRSGGALYSGIWLSDVSNGTVQRSWLVDNYEGVTLNSTRDMTIFGSKVLRNTFAGVYATHSDRLEITENRISNSTHGVFLDECADSILSENTISAVNCSIIAEQSNAIVISKNNVSASRYGIFLNGSPNCSVVENTISKNTCGVYVSKSSPVELADNIFNGNGIDIQSDVELQDDDIPWLLIALAILSVGIVVSLVVFVIWRKGKKTNDP